MALDPTRATFVQREYRYEVQTDNTVLAAYPAAREVELQTQIDQTSAAALATNMLAAAKTPAMSFEIEIDQVIYAEDCDGSLSTFAVTSDTHRVTNRTTRQEQQQIDWATGITKLTVRG